jgi:type VI secretion system protein ImpM
MRCGLYGKLPAKRDFIAIGAPREFLNVWEPWLQGGLSASKVSLGDDWQNAFVTAPIWRFWLGADICGSTVTGAFMSSLDGVGRYFPLTLFAIADSDTAIPPPEFDNQENWFAGVEQFLMSTLEEGIEFESLTAALDQLNPPAFDTLPVTEEPTRYVHGDGSVILPAEGRALTELFGAIREVDRAGMYSSSSFWWTAGGEGYQPVAAGAKKMPDPFLFAGMLTGQFVAPSG